MICNFPDKGLSLDQAEERKFLLDTTLVNKSSRLIKDLISDEPIQGIIDTDELIWSYAWDWRIRKIFDENPMVSFVGLTGIQKEHKDLCGYWWSHSKQEPPMKVVKAFWPLIRTDVCGPGPFFFRTKDVISLLGRIHPILSPKTPLEISRMLQSSGKEVWMTTIPFEKTNFYI